MKKKLLLGLILIVGLSMLCAQSIEDLVASVLVASDQVSRYESSRQQSLLALEMEDVVQEPLYSYNLGTAVYSYDKTLGSNFTYNPGVQVSYKDTDNDLVYTAGMDTNLSLSKNSKSGSLQPKFSISKTLDLGYVYDVSSINRAKNLLRIELTYQTNLVNLEISVLSSIKSLLSQQISIEQTQRSLNSAQNSLQKALTLKTITEGTVRYQDMINSIDSIKVSLQNAKDSYEVALNNFEKKFGVKFSSVTIKEPTALEITPKDEGNSNVLLAQYAYDLATEAIKKKTAETKTLIADSSLGAKLNFSNSNSVSINASAGATYNTSTGLSANSRVDLNWDVTNKKLSPTLMVSGKYSPSNTSQSDDLQLKQLEYEELNARLNYEDTLIGYLDSILDYQSQYRVLESSIRGAKATLSYQKAALENTKAKLELGLVTQADVDTQVFEIKKAENNLNSYFIDMLILEKRVELLQL